MILIQPVNKVSTLNALNTLIEMTMSHTSVLIPKWNTYTFVYKTIFLINKSRTYTWCNSWKTLMKIMLRALQSISV